MKYCSVDIETTSLNLQEGQILEIGLVVDDLKNPKPLESLPKLDIFLSHPKIYGDLECIALHLRTGFWEAYEKALKISIIEAESLIKSFFVENFGYDKITFAGKNVVSFDLKWLLFYFKDSFEEIASHRAIDVGFSFMQPEDETIPSLKTCLQRAGIDGGKEHFALNDALNVVKLIRKIKLGYVEN